MLFWNRFCFIITGDAIRLDIYAAMQVRGYEIVFSRSEHRGFENVDFDAACRCNTLGQRVVRKHPERGPEPLRGWEYAAAFKVPVGLLKKSAAVKASRIIALS